MQKHITIGVAGHVDHGKTSLIHLLNKKDHKNLTYRKVKTGKKRIYSDKVLVTPWSYSDNPAITFIDVPGHIRFSTNTICGLSFVDMAVLVIAANDGIMPQTIEHLNILNFFKVKKGFIVITKTDLADDEILEIVELEIEEIVRGTFLEKKPVLQFSAINQNGFDEICRTIIKEAKNIDFKNSDQFFRLYIDHVWSISGFGTVVSGTACSGSINSDDTLYLLPLQKKTRARFIEVHHNKVQRVFAGQRVGLNLKNVSFKEVKRGMVLSQKDTCISCLMFNAEIKLLETSETSLKNYQKIKVYTGTSKVNAVIILMEGKNILPGEKAFVQLRIKKETAILLKDTFVISLMNIQKIIGGGIILEITKEKFRKAKEKKIVPFLKAMLSENLKKIIEHYIEKNSNILICSMQISQKTGFTINKVESILMSKVNTGEMLVFKKDWFIEKKRYQDIKKRVYEIIKNYFLENPLEISMCITKIKNRLLPFSENLIIQKVIKELIQKGKIDKKSKGFGISNSAGVLSEKQQNLTSMLIDFAHGSDLMHFSAGKFCKYQKMSSKKDEVQKSLDYLHNHNKLIKLNNERYITNIALEKIKKKVENFIVTNGSLSISDCKEVLGYGRSRGVPVFEYLDHIGFTNRMGNKRILKE